MVAEKLICYGHECLSIIPIVIIQQRAAKKVIVFEVQKLKMNVYVVFHVSVRTDNIKFEVIFPFTNPCIIKFGTV